LLWDCQDIAEEASLILYDAVSQPAVVGGKRIEDELVIVL
jgi:hypothetical protein